jgi:hypothetical protein
MKPEYMLLEAAGAEYTASLQTEQQPMACIFPTALNRFKHQFEEQSPAQ